VRGGMGGRDLNNRINTLKTLSTCGTIAGRIEIKEASKLMYYLTNRTYE